MLWSRSVRPLRFLPMLLVSWLAVGISLAQPRPKEPQKPEYRVPQSLSDLGDVALSKASVKWREQIAETRKIVDVVCLVPNRETFLKVLAKWDDKHYFPILMDDTEYAVKFIREFRPKKIVRFPERPATLPDDAVWVQALTATISAVLSEENKPKAPVRGNLFFIRDGMKGPGIVERRSPGIVLTRGGNDSIAAAALAAGRRQGLMLWPEDKGWKDTLTFEEATGRTLGLNELIKETKVATDQMGDEVDFVTIVGDMPYRYTTPDGINCLDDLMGRLPEKEKGVAPRWAYLGRIVGSMEQQIYQVMCGLFLQPTDATLFNGYDPGDARFQGYSQSGANARLTQFGFKTEQVGMGSLGNWQKAFLPKNSAGLLIINTSGNPSSFNVRGGNGTTWDIPWTDPARIHIIHSFSAADAQDPYTIAGRWLVNGAYGYFGSVHEPYLQAFRSPGLIADALAEGYPWAAAVRQTPGREPFGNPWRLIVFGDPMMTVARPGDRPARTTLPMFDSWPAFAFEPIPPNDSAPLARFAWCVRQYLVWSTGADPHQSPKSVLSVLKAIDRTSLPEAMRVTRDELLGCLAIETNHHELAISLAEDVPASARSKKLTRMIETACYVRLQNALSRAAIEDAAPAWRAIVLVCESDELRTALTAPMRAMITSPIRRRIWIRTLEGLKSRSGIDPKLKKWAEELLIEAENIQLKGTQ
ncbi:hypothetical protein GC170_03460 [bacterium]|nr:hypothetical protein [bacterium]